MRHNTKRAAKPVRTFEQRIAYIASLAPYAASLECDDWRAEINFADPVGRSQWRAISAALLSAGFDVNA